MADTLTIARNLSAAGIARTQAEAIANAIGEWHGEVATKDFVRSEISALRGDMNAEISALRGEMNAEISALRGDMSALETRLVRWIIGAGFVYTSLLFAAIQFMLSP